MPAITEVSLQFPLWLGNSRLFVLEGSDISRCSQNNNKKEGARIVIMSYRNIIYIYIYIYCISVDFTPNWFKGILSESTTIYILDVYIVTFNYHS